MEINAPEGYTMVVFGFRDGERVPLAGGIRNGNTPQQIDVPAAIKSPDKGKGAHEIDDSVVTLAEHKDEWARLRSAGEKQMAHTIK